MPKNIILNLPVSKAFALIVILTAGFSSNGFGQTAASKPNNGASTTRKRISINQGWKFYKYDATKPADSLIYDVRPDANEDLDARPADAKPTEAVKIKESGSVLKPYILPTGNELIGNPARRYTRPKGDPGSNFPFVQAKFDDQTWQSVDLPHDWAISGPFYTGWQAIIGGGMGRLPVQGVAWYRKKITVEAADAGKCIYLDVDGAMSYAMVWINGHLAGGWPYGYSSWRVDLTPYVHPGAANQLAIRLDNPANSSRWYPGGGIYRNVWLTKVNPVHVKHWGTFITTSDVSKSSAKINLTVAIENTSAKHGSFMVGTDIYLLDNTGRRVGNPVVKMVQKKVTFSGQAVDSISVSAIIPNPKLWFPLPNPARSRYVAVTTITSGGSPVDEYETRFGIRSVTFDANKGIYVNGEKVYLNGVNQHADLGSLGMAFNGRAAERQLEALQDLGCNAIRLAHNPPSPELLELTDKMGFLIIDEIFDAWERKKPALDFHLIFPDWSEQDLRALIRRDRNHPSVILWSFGNEVGEQYTGNEGGAVARRLYQITKNEDPTRPATLSMNYAKPEMPLPAIADVISLNYQGEGIRNAPAYSGLKGISTPPLFPAFHARFPDKVIISSENAAALSSRGEYFFPVFDGNSSPVTDKMGGDSKKQQISGYELYSVDFGASADKVFATMAQHPFVAGGFAWTGWDYLGEPTPYYLSRSSYFGIIDLAGFKKDRYYLYQSQWRPQLPMAHILPHWNWPERLGLVTPVHVFTSGDEGELFLNGKSLGRKKMGPYEYRLRWDSVKYQPGELKVVTYKNNKKWAEDIVRTTGAAERLLLSADRSGIVADGKDLAFITVKVTDTNGLMVPRTNNLLHFSIEGPGDIVATDNGDASSMVSFSSHQREAFNGLCLVIVRAKPGQTGAIKLTAGSDNLSGAAIVIKSMKAD